MPCDHDIVDFIDLPSNGGMEIRRQDITATDNLPQDLQPGTRHTMACNYFARIFIELKNDGTVFIHLERIYVNHAM